MSIHLARLSLATDSQSECMQILNGRKLTEFHRLFHPKIVSLTLYRRGRR